MNLNTIVPMSFFNYTKSFKMSKLLNGFHNGNVAISPELVESQPQIMKDVLKSRRKSNKVSCTFNRNDLVHF